MMLIEFVRKQNGIWLSDKEGYDLRENRGKLDKEQIFYSLPFTEDNAEHWET